MGEWWHNWWDWWDEFKFKNPWWACSLQYFSLFLLFLLVGPILSGILSDMANVDYFRYPLSETFRHPFNLSANLTINRTPIMQQTETYAAEMYADNARSILCTLVASEAAIVAIVVSLTLIAIELTASAYSPRVIKIALRNPNLTILLLIYGVAIFSSIILIKQLPYESRFPTEDVSLAFWLGVFSYVTFVLYFLSTIRLMMPENIIKSLSQDVTKDKILNYIKSKNSNGVENRSKKSSRQKVNNTKVKSTEDPVQPIVDIIYGSLGIHDLETIRYGLKIILERIEAINLEEKDQEVLSKYFSVHLRRVGKLAASTADEGSTKEVITTLKKIGEKTVYKQLEDATKEVISDIKAVGEAAMEKGLKDAISEAISSLNDIGKAAAKERLEKSVKEVAPSLGDVGRAAANKGLEGATKEVASSLGDVGRAAANKGLEGATKAVASSLGDVGIAAADKGLEDVTLQTVNSLETVGSSSAESQLGEATLQTALSLKSVGKTAAKKELEVATEEAAKSLGAVGKAAVENRLEAVTKRVASSLEVVGETAAEKGLEDATWETVVSLGAVGETAAENRLEVVTEQAVFSLGAVGKMAAEKGKELEDATEQAVLSLEVVGEAAAKSNLEHATTQAALSLLAVGKAAMENELEAAARQAASALASLSSKEIVETTIHNYELNLRDSDRSSYLKCKMLYEQELEKRK